ncbi:MFS transporter [Heyndrickxia acidiproducens]|uniref:MFS transporter n=1 Tax=Heyndrickxia acidiproducens TaxID=1121084 RepID=UPI000477BDA0|nr:MFS transporter [Heyndrickxia acidiproducens]
MNFGLMKKKEFRNFFLADIISGFGVGMTTVGANWYMLQQTHSNKYVGLYLTINVLAGFLMSPIAGVLTDKYPRKNVILFTFLGRALPMIVISAYFYLNGFSIELMYLLSILTGAGWITYMAASRSYVQIILPLIHLLKFHYRSECSLPVHYPG